MANNFKTFQGDGVTVGRSQSEVYALGITRTSSILNDNSEPGDTEYKITKLCGKFITGNSNTFDPGTLPAEIITSSPVNRIPRTIGLSLGTKSDNT